MKFKINSITTLIHRAYTLSSSYLEFDKEIKFLKDYFLKNGFHPTLFYHHVKKFLNKKMNPPAILQTVNKMDIYHKIVFLNDHLHRNLNRDLTKTVTKYFPQIKLNLIPMNNNNIKKFFQHKEKTPNTLCSSIVYNYKCPNCQLGYIGSSNRCLRTRVGEHRGISERTGRPLAKPLISQIRSHQETCNTPIRSEDFSILFKASENCELRIAESIFIRDEKPTLNIENSSFNLSL